MKISDLTPIIEAEDPALVKLKAAVAKMKELKPELARGGTQPQAAGGAQTQAAGGARPASGQRTVTSRTSVSGTIRMGRPEGPIEFNGRTVNPGDPQYQQASDALMAKQREMQQRQDRFANRGSARARAGSNTAPVQQGATQTRDIDF